MAGYSGSGAIQTPAGSVSTATDSQAGSSYNTDNSGVFQPSTVGASFGGSSTYNAFGLPTGLGSQQIFIGPQGDNGTPDSGGVGYGETSDYGPRGGQSRRTTPDSYQTVDDFIKHIADQARSTNPLVRAAWIDMQRQLQASGAYGSSTHINFGGWGVDDMNAIRKAVQGYLGQGDQSKLQTFNEYLTQQAQSGAQNGLDTGNGGSGGSGSMFNPSSPDVISQAGDKYAQGELGRSLSNQETNSLIGQVQGQEQSAYDNGDLYLHGVTPDSLARDFVVQNNLPEYTQHQAASYMNIFANLFLKGDSQRATIGPGDVALGSAPTNGS